MSNRLLVITPSRGRPGSVERLLKAFNDTNAFDVADLLVMYDRDDPCRDAYHELVGGVAHPGFGVMGYENPHRRGLVESTNLAACRFVDRYFAMASLGDDHVPRTYNWASIYLNVLSLMWVGIVYGDDLHRGAELPTQWAMTTNIIAALGVMMPARTEHLFCDRAIMTLGAAAGCLAYLSNVKVEHMHYQAGKSTKDKTYRSVNSKWNFAAESARYQSWLDEEFAGQVEKVKQLRRIGRELFRERR